MNVCPPFYLLCTHVNDIENIFQLFKRLGMLKMFMILYADDIVIFAESAQELQIV